MFQVLDGVIYCSLYLGIPERTTERGLTFFCNSSNTRAHSWAKSTSALVFQIFGVD